jgi:hypothetical protein
MHPDLAKVVWLFNRYHHQVNYKPFAKNNLIKKNNSVEINTINNFDMVLNKVDT